MTCGKLWLLKHNVKQDYVDYLEQNHNATWSLTNVINSISFHLKNNQNFPFKSVNESSDLC